MNTLKAKQFHLIDDMDTSAMALAAVEHVEAFAGKVSGLAAQWNRRVAERRALMGMSPEMLDDIGLTRGQVDREAAKYFWQK